MKVYLILEHGYDDDLEMEYDTPTKIFDTREKAEEYINNPCILAAIYEMEVE